MSALTIRESSDAKLRDATNVFIRRMLLNGERGPFHRTAAIIDWYSSRSIILLM